jgi:hypothetical protein
MYAFIHPLSAVEHYWNCLFEWLLRHGIAPGYAVTFSGFWLLRSRSVICVIEFGTRTLHMMSCRFLPPRGKTPVLYLAFLA